MELNESFQENESKLVELIEHINSYRQQPQPTANVLNDPKLKLFRRSMLAQFPFMAKL